MNVAIVGFKKGDLPQVAQKMEELIQGAQFFLFNVLVSTTDSVGYQWAVENGAPVRFVKADMKALIEEGDYFLMKYDGTPQMHEFIFRVMRSGKHGTVVEEVKWT